MKPLIYIAGGGTGGHIYPGVAIARALMTHRSQIQIEFVGSQDGLETRIVPREGFQLHCIAGGRLNFQGKLHQKIWTLAKIPVGLFQSFALILKTKPAFVLGVGGFASGPFVLAAAILGVPCGIWEPNAQPGLANRWLSRFVDVCYVVFADADRWLRNKAIRPFGMPVRAEIEVAGQKPWSEKKTSSADFHILSFGGSQGSRIISSALTGALLHPEQTEFPDWTKDLKVVHQIGAVDFASVAPKYEKILNIVTPLEFIYEMPKYYSEADLVVVRGGASTLVEVSAFGVIPIVIPLPAADDHQLRNAEVLEKAGAGKILLQKDLNPKSLVALIEELRRKPEVRAQMSRQLKSLFKPLAAEKIAQDVLLRMKVE
jgi:UDP-N-acetylglucosamine--N-acetylmuramyl-(pentapeptide) pyrophosphoryl-undecaprenol N-acetylglucosamine transferase